MKEAELLFTGVLDCDMLSLRLNRGRRLRKEEASFIASALRRRIAGEPLQYILGKSEFMGLKFKVDPRALIPRPETELLVEKTIELVASCKAQVASLNILDLGTGSGCIAVSLAKLLPGAKISATDISADALEVAEENARLNNVSIKFLQSDLFTNYQLGITNYDIIISNPPYIAEDEIDTLQPEIQYEPGIALNGGEDGLDFYRRLAAESSGYLNEKGLLILEMGFGQADRIRALFRQSGKFIEKETVRDYNNIERILVLERV